MNRIFILVVSLSIVFACSSDDNSGGSQPSDNFNREEMLVFLADNIIIPGYQDLNNQLVVLVDTKNTFVETPNQENLDLLRTAWNNAYLVWQHQEMFNIGKAEEILYHFQMNIYPTNVDDIENNVTSDNVDLSHPNNNDAVGFPALDYLLFGIAESDQDILAKYTTDSQAESYKTYLSDLVNQMKTLTETVLNDWTGSYRDNFISSTDNTASSAVNKFVNDFIFYYEKGLRANKIGIPAGNFSNAPIPESVEAFYYAENSKKFTLEALQAVQDLFNGTAYNGNTTGSSLRNYLNNLDRQDLVGLINNQFDEARSKVQQLDNNYFNQITTDNTKMTQAYDTLQAAVVLLKVDMLQAFNISVDYVDADGD
jgi:predicted lipoprotein